ncbi:PREDICTED: inactive poly [ADP-ribose] polymerase RCD1 isoform X2 [Ipomoea nil]|uniref:inactive poly [ADP-ribose] polymerase RCD1 isoform X2 n=1 Tax=Ipomoea nil TaxID=35883 RepID=UPI000901F6DC|nr:PREDICTED: inactive poly [ADP-ribose] polymerase RCD1 isoform X2 [Ipomoea nil]
MDVNLGRELDRHYDVDLKRKWEAQSDETFSNGTTCLLLPNSSPPNSCTDKLGKRRKLNGVEGKCGFHIRKPMVQHYLNLKRSGPPKRLMYYQNDEWTDFPEDILAIVRKDLQMEKSVIEVDFFGRICVLDFVSVMLVDLKTGSQQPIAWIDEAGNRFFPENFTDCDEVDEYYETKNGNNYIEVNLDNLVSNDMKLKIKIEVNGSNISKPEESCGESNTIVRLVNGDLEPEVKDSNMENIDHYVGSSAAKCDEGSAENEQREEKATILGTPLGYLESDSVRKMFFSGVKPSAHADIIDIYRGLSIFMKGRSELFLKQAEIVKKLHGDANIRFAWLPSSKSVLSRIMKYGLVSCDTIQMKSPYCYGVHLVAIDHTEISANYCDVDENGVRHMILCRVIMGNMEPVHLVSKQFHPSNEAFDNGVDDCQNPKHYIVWSMNMNTHIYPEYAVSFKFSSEAEGALVESENLNDISGVSGVSTCCQVSSDQANNNRQILLQNHQGRVLPRIPRSPWMPFPTLFDAISKEVDPEKMGRINSSYELFKSKKISRDDLIRKLRLTVGDTLLRNTITSLQGKMMLQPPGELVTTVKPEPGN